MAASGGNNRLRDSHQRSISEEKSCSNQIQISSVQSAVVYPMRGTSVPPNAPQQTHHGSTVIVNKEDPPSNNNNNNLLPSASSPNLNPGFAQIHFSSSQTAPPFLQQRTRPNAAATPEVLDRMLQNYQAQVMLSTTRQNYPKEDYSEGNRNDPPQERVYAQPDFLSRSVVASHELSSNRNSVTSEEFAGIEARRRFFEQRQQETQMTPIQSAPEMASLLQKSNGEDRGSNMAHFTQRVLDLLSEDNRKLRAELDVYIRKTAKLQQLELSCQRFQRDYEDLVRRTSKWEELENQMQQKVEAEWRRLSDENSNLRAQLQEAVHHIESLEEQAGGRNQASRQDLLIAQLISQNNELLACKERQEMELEAQRGTLEEQRSHIRILEKAVDNAHEKFLKQELELKTQREDGLKLKQYQMRLEDAIEEMGRREEANKRNSALLEKELTQLRLQRTKLYHRSRPTTKEQQDYDLLGDSPTESETFRLQREIEVRDEEIARLKALNHSLERRLRGSKELEDESLQLRCAELEARLVEKEALISIMKRKTTSSASSFVDNSSFPVSSPVDVTRQRLEVVRRRLLQSSSPARSPISTKLSSHRASPGSFDSTYGLRDPLAFEHSSPEKGTGRKKTSLTGLSERPRHWRTQSSGEGSVSRFTASSGLASDPESFTFPRGTTLAGDRVSSRPKSVDDQLVQLETQREEQNAEEKEEIDK